MKYRYTYSQFDYLMADPVQPTPEKNRIHQLSRMYEGLQALEKDANPSYDDWTVVSDALNMMETLIEMGWATDPDGLIEESVQALAIAGQRHVDKGVPIRLNGQGIQVIRGLLEDYSAALEELPHRTMVSCHRKTEKRVQDILAGRVETHDVQVNT
jgi:uncharacterized protein YyaL (SSP411 family)